MGHPDPEQCGEMALKWLGNDLSKFTAIDFGCGTGLVGQSLKRRGVGSLVGIDASKGMIDQAAAKSCFNELIQMFLGKPNEFPVSLRNRFEIVTAAAILAEGHLMSEVFDEMIHTLKQGGYAIFTTREMYLDKYGYRKAIESLEERGYWQKVDESTFKKYHNI